MKKTVVVLMLMLIISTSSTFASGPNGASPYFEISENEKLEATKLRNSVLNGDTISMNSLPYYYKILNVLTFQQTNSYYCGPATTKQVTHFINGYSSGMESIATTLETNSTTGTVVGNIHDYLNQNTSKSYVIEWDTRDYLIWENQIKYGMDNNKPAVLLIKPSTSLGFPYNSNGHYVNSSGLEINTGGISPDKVSNLSSAYYVKIRITDPWGEGLGNRWYDSRNVWQAIRDHAHKVMIY